MYSGHQVYFKKVVSVECGCLSELVEMGRRGLLTPIFTRSLYQLYRPLPASDLVEVGREVCYACSLFVFALPFKRGEETLVSCNGVLHTLATGKATHVSFTMGWALIANECCLHKKMENAFYC